ncbi:MAG TPA: hypothetical protein VMM76_14455 [Pirellulaceae bacterium]|nr:hypothetical protein [Pirellulaceae bacterium]
MSQSIPNPDAVLKYDVEVGDQGRVELIVPFATGARIVVYVRRESDESVPDLMAAAESSLGFWDNPLDDEDWNDA